MNNDINGFFQKTAGIALFFLNDQTSSLVSC